jgi:hypothetical protein
VDGTTPLAAIVSWACRVKHGRVESDLYRKRTIMTTGLMGTLADILEIVCWYNEVWKQVALLIFKLSRLISNGGDEELA